MPTEFDKWKIADLTKYLSQRCFRSGQCRKNVLVRLCRIVEEHGISAEPSTSQQQAEKGERLKEILTVSRRLRLQGPESSVIQWSASFADYPEINLLHLYAYFINSPSPAYNMEHLQAYKALSAYKNALDGFVDQIFVSTSLPDSWLYLKGTVYASQRLSEKYDAWVLMKREGTIRSCHCGCAAGLGEACSHVAALLFYVLIINESGMRRKLTPTDQRCQWLAPKTKDSSSVLVSECGGSGRKKPNLSWITVPNSNAEKLDLFDKIAPNSVLSISRKAPTTEVTSGEQHEPPRRGQWANMPSTVGDIVYWYSSAIQDADVDQMVLAVVIMNSVSPDSSRVLEEATRQQSESSEWSLQRYGRITASNAHLVRTFMGPRGGFLFRRTPVSTLKKICRAGGDSNYISKAVTYGNENEELAAQSYLEMVGARHHGRLELRRTGLVVPVCESHIGASIDRMAVCTCGQKDCRKRWIVEIKCPWRIRSMPPGSPVAVESLPYLMYGDDDGDVILRESSAYYTQIQMQMAVLEVDYADLWVWSPRAKEAPLAVSLTFDGNFWKYLKAKLDVFYIEYVAPLLLSLNHER